jgi:hypothetical protein
MFSFKDDDVRMQQQAAPALPARRTPALAGAGARDQWEAF